MTHYRAKIICKRKDWLKKTYRSFDGVTLKDDYEKGPLGYKVALIFPQAQLRKFKASMAKCAGIVSVDLERVIVKNGIIASAGGIAATGSVKSRRLPRHIGRPVGETFDLPKEEIDKLFKS